MRKWPLILSLAGLLPALAPWGGAADARKATAAPAEKATYAAQVAPLEATRRTLLPSACMT